MSVKISKDKIPGGLADKAKGKKFDPKQLAKGIKVEMEHTKDKSLAREIAKDHLVEDPKYYDHLIEMEKKVKKGHIDVRKILKYATMFFKYAEYDFKTKMRINEVVIQELAREADVEENDAAIGILESPIHSKIQGLAEAIHDEAIHFNKLPKAAQDIIWKYAQVPNVRIQPGRIEATVALEILQMFANDTGRQNYFTDPNDPSKPLDIVVGPSANYGHVETEVFQDPEADEQPTTVYVNADRIVSESGGQQSGKAAALAAAKVIAHEIGHLGSYQLGVGFQGGETPAEAEEMSFDNWLNSGGRERVENLPSYQSLPG